MVKMLIAGLAALPESVMPISQPAAAVSTHCRYKLHSAQVLL